MFRGPAISRADYDEYREKQAEISRERSRQGREIGPLPEVIDSRRKARCRKSLKKFCLTYFPERFPLKFAPDHLLAIDCIEECVLQGGQYAFALPRGMGKTSLSETGCMWALAYGFRKFVPLIGATEAAGDEMLDSIKVEFETNDLLLEDFPEICYPIRQLEGISHRAPGQTLGSKRTRIGWTGKELVLPTVDGSPASGSVLRVCGITGRIRGMRYTTPEGKVLRPDLVVIDDPQTDESARSPTQNAYRESVLTGAILGLAGPTSKIAAVMPCTVIYPGDMADRILDRDRNPEWNGTRSQMMPSLPESEKLWDEYARLRAEGLRAGDRGQAATKFYRKNRKAMDSGAEVSWPQRFNPDELSAIQHAMNRRIDNPISFAAEYQNEPLSDEGPATLEQITAEAVLGKLNNLPRGQVPPDCTRLTGGIDVQGNILYWLLTAFDEKFGGSIVQAGTWPHQNRAYFAHTDARPSLETEYPDLADDARIYAGLRDLTGWLTSRNWPVAEGESVPIEMLLVDSGFKTDTVHQFCRQSPHASILLPSKGQGITAGKLPMDQYQQRPGDRQGWNWRIARATPGKRHVSIDTNSWKRFLADRLLSPPATPGCLYLNGTAGHEVQLLADHLASESRVETEGRGRKVHEWTLRADAAGQNHWFDCLVLAAVAASVRGLKWDAGGLAGEPQKAPPKGRTKMKLSEIQARKRARAGI